MALVEYSVPVDPTDLFGDDQRALMVRSVLPAGRVVRLGHGLRATTLSTFRPSCWLSDEPVDPSLWYAVADAPELAGFYPVLVPAARISVDPQRWTGNHWPWGDDSLQQPPPRGTSSNLADQVLAGAWARRLDSGVPVAFYEPFGSEWPGMAAPGMPQEPVILDLAKWISGARGREIGLCLVPADDGADALARMGWNGWGVDEGVVVKSWQERFRVRLVWADIGGQTLLFAVDAPPTDVEHALRVAAEHVALGTDEVGFDEDGLRGYASSILGAREWWFWWD
jgi:hypothetical protein